MTYNHKETKYGFRSMPIGATLIVRDISSRRAATIGACADFAAKKLGNGAKFSRRKMKGFYEFTRVS